MKYEILSTRKLRKIVKGDCPKNLYNALKRYCNLPQEHILVISMNLYLEIIAIHIVSIGTISKTIAHPREIFRKAIIDNAFYIVIAHNHHSNHLKPSNEDYDVTANIKVASDIIGIELLDSMIIGKYGYFSFREEGILKSCKINIEYQRD